jgi:hypothetical protein
MFERNMQGSKPKFNKFFLFLFFWLVVILDVDELSSFHFLPANAEEDFVPNFFTTHISYLICELC